MGRQSRLRAERRRQAGAADRPVQILRELYGNIRSVTHEHPRRAWELMLEVMGELSGVNSLRGGCLTDGSRKLLGDLPKLESMLTAYVESWDAELAACKLAGAAVTDPIGTILEENEATNEPLGQFFTPPSVVRLLNSLTLDSAPPEPGRNLTGLDPCCGSGRFALDALVHNDALIMFNIDVDLGMVRAALLNFRFAQQFTHARIPARLSGNNLFTDAAIAELRTRGLQAPVADQNEGDVLVLGGRAWILHANSLLVDVRHADNWRYSWLWDPPPWQSTLKLDGFPGTYDDWRKSRSAKEVEDKLASLPVAPKQPRMDFRLDDDPPLDAPRARATSGGRRR